MTEKREIEVVHLDKDFNASFQRVEELRAGRVKGDIPSYDEYWKALKKHQQSHGMVK